MMEIFNRVNILFHNKKEITNINKKEIYYFSHGIGKKEIEKIKNGLIIKQYKNKQFPILTIKYKKSTEIALFGKEFYYQKQPALLIIYIVNDRIISLL